MNANRKYEDIHSTKKSSNAKDKNVQSMNRVSYFNKTLELFSDSDATEFNDSNNPPNKGEYPQNFEQRYSPSFEKCSDSQKYNGSRSSSITTVSPFKLNATDDDTTSIPEFQYETPARRIKTLAPRVQTPAQRIITPAPRVQTPAQRIKTPASRVQTPSFLTPSSRVQIQEEEFQTWGEGAQTSSQRDHTQVERAQTQSRRIQPSKQKTQRSSRRRSNSRTTIQKNNNTNRDWIQSREIVSIVNEISHDTIFCNCETKCCTKNCICKRNKLRCSQVCHQKSKKNICENVP